MAVVGSREKKGPYKTPLVVDPPSCSAALFPPLKSTIRCLVVAILSPIHHKHSVVSVVNHRSLVMPAQKNPFVWPNNPTMSEGGRRNLQSQHEKEKCDNDSPGSIPDEPPVYADEVRYLGEGKNPANF